MKTTPITLFLCLLFTNSFSQDLAFNVHNTYASPVKKETLESAKTMIDVTGDYPTSWISNYISTEVMGTCNGKIIKAQGKNDVLTPQQQEILRTADIGTNVVFDVNYKYKNTITENMDTRTMHFSVSIAPEIEAEYVGGTQQMTNYLKENAISKITDTKIGAVVRFTINENGEIANALISQSSKDIAIDNLLLETINKMPKWKPAQNSTGVSVKQDFELSVGNGGC